MVKVNIQIKTFPNLSKTFMYTNYDKNENVKLVINKQSIQLCASRFAVVDVFNKVSIKGLIRDIFCGAHSGDKQSKRRKHRK